MKDRNILFQILNMEKQLSNTYNRVIMQCSDNKLRSEMSNILENQNNIVFTINDEIEKRKIEKTATSSNQEKENLKQIYSQYVSKL